MSTLAIGKEEAVRRLPIVEKEIHELAEKINISDGIICLLCFEDVVENAHFNILSDIVSSKGEAPGVIPQKINRERMALIRYVMQQFYLINSAIAELHKFGKRNPSQLLKIPELAFWIGINYSREEALNVCRETGLIKSGDHYSGADIHFIAGMDGIRILIVRNAYPYAISILDALVKLIAKLLLREILQSCIKLNLELIFYRGQEVPDIKLPKDITPEWVFEKEGYTTRMLTASDYHTFEWTSDFKEVSARNVRILSQGKTPENLKLLEQERQEIFRGYLQFPNFDKTFRETYGYSAKSLKVMVKALELTALGRAHPVVRDSWRRFIVKIAKKVDLPKPSVETILRSLTYDGDNMLADSAIIAFDHEIAYNFHRLSVAVRMRLEKCFREAYDNNMKGKVFEEKCRELLKSKGFVVFPQRIVLEEEFLPKDVSNELWGHIKRSTDLDGLGNKENLILLLECKEKKPSTKRVVRLKNLFQKFSVELYYKAKWICENKRKLEHYMGGELASCLSVSKDNPSFIIPLVVCNFLVSDVRSDYSPIITYPELRRISTSQWKDIRDKLVGKRENRISTFYLKVGLESIKSVAFRLPE